MKISWVEIDKTADFDRQLSLRVLLFSVIGGGVQ